MCIVPGCERVGKIRGLCHLCYQAARQRVKSGKTTWEQLESFGLVKPLIIKVADNAFTVAFKKAIAKPTS